MGSNARVINLSSGCRLKRSQAQGRINHCLSIWVDDGFTIRDLAPLERFQARSKQVKVVEPIPFAEIPGLIYQPAERNQTLTHQGHALIQQANRFCLEHA